MGGARTAPHPPKPFGGVRGTPPNFEPPLVQKLPTTQFMCLNTCYFCVSYEYRSIFEKKVFFFNPNPVRGITCPHYFNRKLLKNLPTQHTIKPPLNSYFLPFFSLGRGLRSEKCIFRATFQFAPYPCGGGGLNMTSPFSATFG